MAEQRNIIGLQAAEYARAGWALVRLLPRSKATQERGWNTREHAITDPDVIARWHGNVGVALAWSRLVSIDIDDVVAAAVFLHAVGVHLPTLLADPANVGIDSGRLNRAKLLFRIPADVDPLSLVTHRIQTEDRSVILELRCAGKNGVTVQDVLPPSVHPDTGQPYRWVGDWRRVPEMPPALLALWRKLSAGNDSAHVWTGPLPDGTGLKFADVVARLEACGCEPKAHGPTDVRAYCPNHRGKSGTTLHVNESLTTGNALLFCHAGCDWRDVFTALGLGPGPEVHMGSRPRADAPRNAQAPDTPQAAPVTLPPIPAALCALPGRLGEVQAWIASTMYKPHDGAAGLVALGLVDYLAMTHTRIASRGGLAMGEFFLVLAPSAFGKESLRMPFRKLAEYGMRERIAMPDLHYSAPSSMQGLQEMLLGSRCVGMLPDEFGDWIAKGEKEPHREQAMAHLMQVYGNPFGVVDVPRAVTRSLGPVREPRMVLFATSTAARFTEVINGSLADRGFLNRFVMLPVGEDALPIGEENDDPLAYEMPQALASLAKGIAKGAQTVTFDAEAASYKNLHLRSTLDGIAASDNRLGGRINEQACRIAAAFALNDGRCVIDSRDMAMAYEIREGLYTRTAEFFAADAVLTGDNPTMRAFEQVRHVLKSNGSLKRSELQSFSRQFRRLGVREQSDVVRALVANGYAAERDGRVYSLEAPG